MSEYRFSLERFEIQNTRALDEDTDIVSFGLKVDDQEFDTKTRSMGDVDNGNHLVNLRFEPITVGPTSKVAFNYQIVNSGENTNKVIAKLKEGATKLFDALKKKSDDPSRPAEAGDKKNGDGSTVSIWISLLTFGIPLII